MINGAGYISNEAGYMLQIIGYWLFTRSRFRGNVFGFASSKI